MSRRKWSPEEGVVFEVDDSTLEVLKRSDAARTQRARLLKVCKVERLRTAAENLLDFFPEFRLYTDPDSAALDPEIAALEQRAVRWSLAEKTGRDARRQAGTRKPRGSRWPELDSWLDEVLKQSPKATAKELWRAIEAHSDSYAPTEGGFYIENNGDRIVDDARGKSIGFSGFQARLTAARKRRE